jgi:hypothetical protein
MSNITQEIKEPTTSSFNPFNIIGGLLSDTIEVVKMTGSELADIPDALADGWNNGALIDTDNAKALKERTNNIVADMVNKEEPLTEEQLSDIDEQIKQLQNLKTVKAELVKE